jgi:hypothetical protein
VLRPLRERSRCQEAAVGLGKKTIGRGLQFSEGGEGKAGWASRRTLGRLAGGLMRGRGEVGRG